MKRAGKIFIIISAIALLSALFLLRDNQEIGSAQTAISLCSDPIPSGKAVNETVNVFDRVYQGYGDLSEELARAIALGEEMVLSMESNPNKKVCDFSKCQTSIIQDKGTAINLNACVSSLTSMFTRELCDQMWGTCLLGCQPLECTGDPCNVIDLNLYTDAFAYSQDVISKQYKATNDYLNLPSKPNTEEIKLEGETKQLGENKLTPTEYALRLVLAAEKQLAPSGRTSDSQKPESCIMSSFERLLVQMGRLEPRGVELCKDVFSWPFDSTQWTKPSYWPRPWAYACSKECALVDSEACLTCLKSDKVKNENSFSAEFNYKYYKTCANECDPLKNAFGTCKQCMCSQFQDEKDPLAYDQKCVDWFCGGSAYNYVCCGDLSGTVALETEIQKGVWNSRFIEHPNCFSAGNYITNLEMQKTHASADLQTFLNFLDARYQVLDGKSCRWGVTSISSNAESSPTMEHCAYGSVNATQFSANGCAHAFGSQHYGGTSCPGKSYAVDIDNVGTSSSMPIESFLGVIQGYVNQFNTAHSGSLKATAQIHNNSHVHVQVCDSATNCGCTGISNDY